MILLYLPGIPVIFPGEKITQESKVLKKIGSMLSGFDTDIHGPERARDGKLYIKVIDNK